MRRREVRPRTVGAWRLTIRSTDAPLDPAAGDGVCQPVADDRGEDRERRDSPNA
jgi:hypothetical protein